ncbi:MAG: glycosyltransferase [Lachnospiraceae bacterium]|nr:glycosyltransferase [Lachnospiraceae bacterium]
MGHGNMNILIFEWGSYNHNDILETFKKKGYGFKVVKHRFEDVNHDDEFVNRFDKLLEDGAYDFVYSTNFFPLVSECCNRKGVKYISWSYDAPLDVPDIERTLGLPCNYAFMYDREQVQGYRNKGFDNVFHLPLAVNTKRLDGIHLSAAERKKYGAQISFVGNLYDSQMLNIRSILDEFHQGYLDAVMKAQSKIYGYYLVDDVLTDELMSDINRTVYDKTVEYRKQSNNKRSNDETDVNLINTAVESDASGAKRNDAKESESDNVLHISREALSYAMAAQITREERLLALKLLSGHYDVKLYSKEKNDLLDKVTYMGTADYDKEMPMVFKSSDINLNMTLRCIRSGIPLRALDIMGAGGFLLSNYQPELAECFVDGEEAVMYESIEDMYAKASFYLANPEIRMEIARRGHEKVSREYRYEDRIDEMFNKAL